MLIAINAHPGLPAIDDRAAASRTKINFIMLSIIPSGENSV
jgi:hypothetical protein